MLTMVANWVGKGTDSLPLYTPEGSSEDLAKMEVEGRKETAKV